MTPNSSPVPVVVALSGRGRTFENLLKASEHGDSYVIRGVIVSNKACKGYLRTVDLGLSVIEMTSDINLENWLKDLRVSKVVLAGYIKKFPLSPDYSVINIHPSLLPKHGGKGMYGRRVHEAVADSGDRFSGASVHLVNENYDEGRCVAQIRADFPQDSNWQTIAAAVFSKECVLYPQVISEWVLGKYD